MFLNIIFVMFKKKFMENSLNGHWRRLQELPIKNAFQNNKKKIYIEKIF